MVKKKSLVGKIIFFIKNNGEREFYGYEVIDVDKHYIICKDIADDIHYFTHGYKSFVVTEGYKGVKQ